MYGPEMYLLLRTRHAKQIVSKQQIFFFFFFFFFFFGFVIFFYLHEMAAPETISLTLSLTLSNGF